MRNFYRFAIFTVVMSLLAGCGRHGISATPSANLFFSNQEYRVSLQYPSSWKANNSYSTPPRYEGNNGFFQISAKAGEGSTIEQVAESDANHKLKPYGTKPSIEKLEIQGQEACLIKPSDDQRKEEKEVAELIIKFPKPIKIGADKYYFFVLYSDKNHIEEIAKTIQFTN